MRKNVTLIVEFDEQRPDLRGLNWCCSSVQDQPQVAVAFTDTTPPQPPRAWLLDRGCALPRPRHSCKKRQA